VSDYDRIKSLSGEIFTKDHMYWMLSGGRVWKAASLAAGVMFSLLSIILFIEYKSLPKHAVIELFQTSVVVFFMIAFWFLLYVLSMRFFLKPNQRYVSWTFGVDGFSLKDKAGNKVITPWTQVKVVNFKSKGVDILCKPFGSRWIPNRLLTDETKRELKALVKAAGVLSK